MTAYPWQGVDHDASISAERNPVDVDQVIVEIVIGEHAQARIVMWAEEFERMAAEAVAVSPPLDPDCLAGKHRACLGRAWDEKQDTEVDCACGCHEVTNVVESP